MVAFETVEQVFPSAEYGMILPISYQKVNRLREEKYLQARAKGYGLVSYVSTRATVFPDLVLGDNCVILDNCVISPFVRIGNNVIVTDGAIIGHHAVLKDHCFVGAGAVILGRVTLGEFCFIGANATVKEEVIVARECVIGTGVVITRNTREYGVYTNPPPRLHRKRSDQLSMLVTLPTRTSELLRTRAEHREGPDQQPEHDEGAAEQDLSQQEPSPPGTGKSDEIVPNLS